MFARASSTLYWPGYRADITRYRATCRTCDRVAPSNPAEPPIFPDQPAYPFHSVCADFFTINSRNYLAVTDRYSNWLSVFQLQKDDSDNVIKTLREYSTQFGIPAILSTDGASVFTSRAMDEFCKRWGIHHRVSSAYYARSNKRAEIGVKQAKRLILDNLLPNGSIDNDKFARALLTYRNNPCPITGLSPAQIIFGRVLRDFLPLQPGKFEPRQEWRQAADARAHAHAQRHILKGEQLALGSKHLTQLVVGDTVAIQNQTGNSPRAWDKTGKVLEVLDNNSYLVKVDGSRHVTKRNRRFLRKIVPFRSQLSEATTGSHIFLPPPPRSSTQHEVPLDDPVDELPHHDQPRLPPHDADAEQICQQESQPAELTPSTGTTFKKKKIKERWILAKPKPVITDNEETPNLSQPTPPPPNISHNQLLEEYQQNVKDLAETSRILYLMISQSTHLP